MADFCLCTCFGVAQQLWSVLGEDDHITFISGASYSVLSKSATYAVPLFSWVYVNQYSPYNVFTLLTN